MRTTIEQKITSPPEIDLATKKAEISVRKKEKYKKRLEQAYAEYEVIRAEFLRRIAQEAGITINQLNDPETMDWALKKIRYQEIKPAVIKGSKSDPRVKAERKKGYAQKIRRKRLKQLGRLYIF